MTDGFDNIINLDSVRQILDAILPMASDLEDDSDCQDDTRSPTCTKHTLSLIHI